MWQYAKLVQTEIGVELATPNLHHALCVLTDQAIEWGDTIQFNELWVERMIGFVKQGVKYKAVRDSEAVIANRLLMLSSLSSFMYGKTRVELMHEAFPNLFGANQSDESWMSRG